MAHVDPSETPTTADDRHAVVARERAAFGGVKVGSAFFGWLVATALTALLTALLAAGGLALGMVDDPAVDPVEEVGAAGLGWTGVVVLLVVVLVSYVAGGYVAGRMARFDGARQGLGVFGWAVIVALLLAVVGLLAGAQYNVLGDLGSFPNVPASLEGLRLQAVVALGGVVVASLVGAVAGGLLGMRYHRRVDRAGLGG